MLFLIGGIYLGIGILAGETVYTVDQFGLRQQIVPLSWFKWVDKKIDRQFTWQDIKWVQIGSDVNRSWGEYQYLKIKLNKWPHNLQLSSDKTDINEYNNFISVFNQINGNREENQYFSKEKISTPSQIYDVLRPKLDVVKSTKVRVKPKFYSTQKAKYIFYFLCILFLGLIGLMYTTGIFKITYAVRFLIIIIPGMGYYFWRLFMKEKK